MRELTPTPANMHPISAGEAGTLPGLFRIRVARTPEAIAYRQYDAGQGVWKSYRWSEMERRVARWRGALAEERLADGERVAVLITNSVEWVCLDQAALSLGLVVVPLYTTDTPGNLAYILADSGARLLLAATREQWEALTPFREKLAALQRVVCLQEVSGVQEPLMGLETWLQRGTGDVAPVQGRPNDSATIVYTSGTTGPPKGVIQSHYGILHNAEAVLRTIPGYPQDLFLSFLPLSHSFERTVGYYLPMMAGACVAYARSVKDLPQDLVTVRPTVLLAVPRVFERIYAGLQRQLQERGYIARMLFAGAVEVGHERFEHLQGRSARPAVHRRLLWAILRRLVAARVMERLGGRLRLVVSGGAPLSPQVARCLVSLGVPLIQGYGLTEASPVVSANQIHDNLPESVGGPLPGVEVRLSEEGELLVRAPSVMLGYWNRAEETRLSVDDDGWLHTGDKADLREGRIHIHGRIKDVLVLSTGEKVSLGDLETAITQHPLFEQAMAVGEGMPYVGALVVMERSAWRDLAAALGLDPDDDSSLHTSTAREAVLERIRLLLGHLPSHAQVRAVHLLPEPWTVQDGLLTPTMKLKRAAIEERFREAIRGLYAGHDVSF